VAARGRVSAGPSGGVLLSAHMNATVVRSAEEFHRAAARGAVAQWNVRDRHMADVLDELAARLSGGGAAARVVVWAHNLHAGDARATEMRGAGQWSLGQLVRERHGGGTVLVGFTTYQGSVLAASVWGGGASPQVLPPALPGSYPALLHRVGVPRFLLDLRAPAAVAEGMRRERADRSVGVVRLPGLGSAEEYYRTRLGGQFDAVVHWDVTRATEPLGP
jgi:erythromycin esterase-like protein